MSAKLLWFAPLLFLTLAQNDAKVKKDLDAMQGAWTMHALEINGKSTAQIQDTLLVVVKDEYKASVKGKEQPGFKLRLDPSKTPKHVDMIRNEGGVERVYKGIYTFDGDTFKICRGISPEHERPGQFETWPDTGCFVVTWKKKP